MVAMLFQIIKRKGKANSKIVNEMKVQRAVARHQNMEADILIARLEQNNDTFKRNNFKLEQTITQQEQELQNLKQTIAKQERQLKTLKQSKPSPPKKS